VATRLRERLAEASGWSRRFAVLDEAISARLAPAAAPDPRVAWAWSRLAGTGGRLDIAALATELGWSRRHLATMFRREAGLTPKAMARVMRFQRAYARLETVRRDGGWASVAADCGFYDQAHLIRDFREFAGRTPTEAVRERAAAASATAGG
jgi:AraC-like DNA-binding protein